MFKRGAFFLLLLLRAGQINAEDVNSVVQSDTSRSFFHWDINFAGFYSVQGTNLTGTGFSHWQPIDQLPRNYIGFEWIDTLGEESWINKRSGPLQLTTIDLNPHIEMDVHPPENTDSDTIKLNFSSIDISPNQGDKTLRIKLVIHDFWFRFEPKGLERTMFQIGHFDIPYGINPILAPRGGQFVMPPEMNDLGLKKDWGIRWKAPAGQYDYEAALTLGIGLGLHDPNWFDAGHPASFLLSARVGAPTYWSFQYGISGLYGKIPKLMADERLDESVTSKWRINLDFFYKLKAHTMFMGQAGFGQNLNASTDQGDESENVFSGHVLLDHVPLWFPWIAVKAQIKTIFYSIDRSDSDHTSGVLELAYSISTPVMLRLDYVHDFRKPTEIGEEDDRIFLVVNVYY